MSKAKPNVYFNKVFNEGKPDDDAVFKIRFDTVETSNCDQLSSISNDSSAYAVFNVPHSKSNIQSIQKANCQSRKIQVPCRVLFFISCVLITMLVSNIITYKTTKNKFLGENTLYSICRSSPCLNGGVCVNDDEQYYCGCTRGFSGTNCEVTPCTGLNCLNGGSCEVSNGTFYCICKSGFSGHLCQELGPCISNPCFNNGSCTVSDNSYSCSCQSGTHGNHCQYLFHETITSQGYPLNYVYGNPMYHIWNIDVGFRNTIVLKFTDFNLENGFDFVKIYNGRSTAYCLVAELTGRTLPAEVSVMGRYMTMVFTSDRYLTHKGFHAVIYKIPSNDVLFSTHNIESKSTV